MEHKWNGKNALRMLLYLALYMVGTAITCFAGSIHPIVFVGYQIIAGILLAGVVITAFRQIQSPGVAAVFSVGVILIFVLMGDASAWHCLPLVVMAVIAEIMRTVCKYNWKGDVISTVVMTFSTFGFYGQIWFNRAYTYECAIEEMADGYADTLMSCSPAWSFPVVMVVAIAASVLIANLTAKQFKLQRE
ncbi:MAG: MptD family putative ECF transporter S component [Clostridia bacterium]|nr:MptD family putative ECF transporter S component [Clostridia bacterium]